jgi:PadR family transcriptional regulator, regulatory protein PadR
MLPSMSRQPDPPGSAALLQGTLDLLILRVVALEPLHGYGIVRRIEQMSGEALQIRQGSLYPALYRMEQRGLLAADWKTAESGKEAKYYRLTRTGRKALESETEGWQRLRGAIDLILSSGIPTEGEA